MCSCRISRTALLAGGMLAFALSFDEVIVTTFTAGQQTTLPIWMLTELVRPRQRPVTNVVAVFVIAVTFLPILAAYYLTRETESVAGWGSDVMAILSTCHPASACQAVTVSGRSAAEGGERGGPEKTECLTRPADTPPR